MSKGSKEFSSLTNTLQEFNFVCDLEASFMLNEIIIKINKNYMPHKLRQFIKNNNLETHRITFIDNNGKLEILIETPKWIEYEPCDEKINFEKYNSFLLKELNMLPTVKNCYYKNNEDKLVINFNNKLESTLEFRSLFVHFNIYDILEFYEGKVVYDVSTFQFNSEDLINHTGEKIDSFFKHVIADKVGIKITHNGKTQKYIRKKELNSSNNNNNKSNNYVPLSSIEKEYLEGEDDGHTIENFDLLEAVYYDYNKNLPIPKVDWLLLEDNECYYDYIYDNNIHKKIKYDSKKLI